MPVAALDFELTERVPASKAKAKSRQRQSMKASLPARSYSWTINRAAGLRMRGGGHGDPRGSGRHGPAGSREPLAGVAMGASLVRLADVER